MLANGTLALADCIDGNYGSASINTAAMFLGGGIVKGGEKGAAEVAGKYGTEIAEGIADVAGEGTRLLKTEGTVFSLASDAVKGAEEISVLEKTASGTAEAATSAARIETSTIATSPYSKMSTSELLDSQQSYEKLIDEHITKLNEYIKDPFKYDNLGILKDKPVELQQKIINGRIESLQKQIIKQQRELDKILTVQKGKP